MALKRVQVAWGGDQSDVTADAGTDALVGDLGIVWNTTNITTIDDLFEHVDMIVDRYMNGVNLPGGGGLTDGETFLKMAKGGLYSSISVQNGGGGYSVMTSDVAIEFYNDGSNISLIPNSTKPKDRLLQPLSVLKNYVYQSDLLS